MEDLFAIVAHFSPKKKTRTEEESSDQRIVEPVFAHERIPRMTSVGGDSPSVTSTPTRSPDKEVVSSTEKTWDSSVDGRRSDDDWISLTEKVKAMQLSLELIETHLAQAQKLREAADEVKCQPVTTAEVHIGWIIMRLVLKIIFFPFIAIGWIPIIGPIIQLLLFINFLVAVHLSLPSVAQQFLQTHVLEYILKAAEFLCRPIFNADAKILNVIKNLATPLIRALKEILQEMGFDLFEKNVAAVSTGVGTSVHNTLSSAAAFVAAKILPPAAGDA